MQVEINRTTAAAPQTSLCHLPPPHPHQTPRMERSGDLDVSDGSWPTGPWRWREVSKLSLTKVWFLFSEALKCGSVKKKLLRKNDTSLWHTSTCSTSTFIGCAAQEMFKVLLWWSKGSLCWNLPLLLCHYQQGAGCQGQFPKENLFLLSFSLGKKKNLGGGIFSKLVSEFLSLTIEYFMWTCLKSVPLS